VRSGALQAAVARWTGEIGSRRRWHYVVAAGAASVLVLAWLHPVAYNAPTLRPAVETLITMLAAAGACLVGVQFADRQRRRDLLLFAAIATLVTTQLWANALPAALHLRSDTGFAAALPISHLIIATVFVFAAFTPADRVATGGRRALLIATLASLLIAAVAEGVGLALQKELLLGRPGSGSDFAFGHPVGVTVLLASVGLLAWAAAELARRGRVELDPGLTLLALALFVLAAAQLSRLNLPSTSPEAVPLAEALRASAVLLILVAAVREHLANRARLVHSAAIAERRRVAEDLHDTLAQDLALIAAHGVTMGQELGHEHPVAVAARRALAISRGTIIELSDQSSRTVTESLEAIADELRARFGIKIVLSVPLDLELASDAREHISRLVREAIANSVRHGGAKHVVVSLRRTRAGVTLRVSDDGHGLSGDSASGSGGGFGIRAMKDRAALIGGHLSLRERKAGGTELRVVFP
jgi:two-component system sensor histidine kinase UhpB